MRRGVPGKPDPPQSYDSLENGAPAPSPAFHSTQVDSENTGEGAGAPPNSNFISGEKGFHPRCFHSDGISKDRSGQPGLVAQHQLLEGRGVILADLEHQTHIGIPKRVASGRGFAHHGRRIVGGPFLSVACDASGSFPLQSKRTRPSRPVAPRQSHPLHHETPLGKPGFSRF